ncbi:hypothetical protein L0P55_19650, partial [Parabacteroides merdae]
WQSCRSVSRLANGVRQCAQRRLHWHAMDCWMVMTIHAIQELKKKRSSWHQTVILKKNLRLLIKQATWLPVVVRQR